MLTSFQTLLLEGKKVSSIAAEESSEGLLKQQVENDPNSIGFVSNYQVDLGGVNSVGFNGVACNRSTVVSGQYAGIARFYEVTKGKATGAVGGFIHWIENSAPARKIISTQWVPINWVTVLERLRRPWPDHRAELTLGAVSLSVGVVVIAMIVFVAIRAWPMFAAQRPELARPRAATSKRRSPTCRRRASIRRPRRSRCAPGRSSTARCSRR